MEGEGLEKSPTTVAHEDAQRNGLGRVIDRVRNNFVGETN